MAEIKEKLPKSTLKLLKPEIDHVSTVLQEGLAKHFASVQVSVVDCPDLTEKPFNLALPGLCGDQKVVDVGGPAFLIPLVDRTKLFNISNIANEVNTTSGLVIGAGAGPWPVVGTNSEMAANVCLQEGDVTVKTKIIKVNTDTMGRRGDRCGH
ncbi:hypothetical protein EB796_015634 [Bugula neritina]|uniref:DUF1907 domain-containing protein n=1 Tax=Bugula neritina TaxID=10212 RepID=A0A7J7JKT8_BUGNE|nr:hypothetical protein EB796_015634 [Bugula neritina]